MIELENVRPGVTVLRMANGPVSALSTEFLVALRETLAKTATTDDALVVTGTGKAFSAGVDLRSYLDGFPGWVDDFWPALSGLFDDLLRYPRPMVAAVNGHAIAGGAVMACCADYRLMSGGTIGMPELLVGIPFPSTAHAGVELALGPKAPALIYTGACVGPEEAVARGFIDEVTTPEELMDRAIARAEQMVRIPKSSFAHTKQYLRRTVIDRLATEADRAADAEARRVWSSAEGRDAIAAYVAATLKPKG